MAKDPTANAAARNITAQEIAAKISFHEEGQPARVWMDLATWRRLMNETIVLTDNQGERHIRYPEFKK